MAKTILVVDDEPSLARLVQMSLQRNGYTVTTAADGLEAMESVAQSRPDLMVLDVMMPHLDGFEVLKMIKSDPATSDIPIIMLTARAQDRDLIEAKERGANIYLTKPINPAELLSHVTAILDA